MISPNSAQLSPSALAARDGGGLAYQAEVRPPRPVAGFNLSHRFAVLSLLVIAFVSLASSAVLSKFLAKTMLHRDAEVSMQFVQNFTQQQNAEGYFRHQSGRSASDRSIENYFSHISAMPDVLRAQVYDVTGAVLWSSNAASIDQTFASNPELDRALVGELAVEAAILESREYIKPEHVFSAVPEKQFVEYYLPVWDNTQTRVVGVVELYKSPDALFQAIRSGLQLIWLCSFCGAILMYAVLFWLVRRGQGIIRQQQLRIASSEGFAAVGEVAASVAHNIRNPLAAIRSSAELMAIGGQDRSGEFAHDIMAEVDRLESWIRNLLSYAHAGTREPGRISANDLLRGLIDGMRDDFARRGVTVALRLEPTVPPVVVDALMLDQIVRTLVANALDAMPAGGALTLSSSRAAAGGIQISVADTGVGIPAEQLKRAFLAPRTTKKHGLGIGLPLVGRTLERMGGGIHVRSTHGRGTSVAITLPFTIPGKQS
ncbi:MAG: ATP-binding protein [Proteobacteria bacterium]|nr:ATP-binding protein [Pseudomonadota bacterium]